jgi:diaminohydroxyphosphoribosylaminopyrimidine deaminase / 5-amino-6-(5-phosphoribosylamino)uracil reductase
MSQGAAGEGKQDEGDRQWMQRALELAAQSVGLSSPNPAVGCVLTQGDRVVGQGFHEYDNWDHAEVVALKQAGELATGATAYVTLEPCSHHGRTGPCADALLAAGVRRVVIATRDPNLVVHGRGIEKLLAGGAEVQTGVLEVQARKLNEGFARFTRSSLPFVTMKVASSLDGRIAPAQDKEKSQAKSQAKSQNWITGSAARQEVHKMRHAADALLTGVGTILADDPLLTDRSGLPRRRPLLRVVLDSTLRTPLDSRLVQTANDDVLIFFRDAGSDTQRALESRGVRLERLERLERLDSGHDAKTGKEGRIAIAAVIERLGALSITNLLVEGGAGINSTVIGEDAADKLIVFYAPLLLGADAVPMLAGIGRRSIENTFQALTKSFTLRKFGDDFAFEAYLRDPWIGVGG